jgi:hypothetical protein
LKMGRGRGRNKFQVVSSWLDGNLFIVFV